MLTEIFGMAWYEVHDEAERLEHAVSSLPQNSSGKNFGL
jgi:Mn-dependent DtxR family transcriptional regulator